MSSQWELRYYISNPYPTCLFNRFSYITEIDLAMKCFSCTVAIVSFYILKKLLIDMPL